MSSLIRQPILDLLRRTGWGRYIVSVYSLRCYLMQCGWFQGLRKNRAINGKGEIIPWYTYSSIEFLKGRISRDMRVFEYGCGGSTIWWSQRVDQVVSCEHSKKWVDLFKEEAPANADLHYCKLDFGGEYCTAAMRLAPDDGYDCIIIDGRDRVNCAKNSIHALSKAGVIIWDNSDRKKYEEGYEFLKRQGFRRLDFTGLGPINPFATSTSIFYRDGNCFNI